MLALLVVRLAAELQAPAWAAQLNTRVFTVEHGLAQSQVTDLLQDRRGYLWLATYGGGVDRFDGVEFVNFGRAQGLGSGIVWALAEDSRGGLWIGTDGGLFRYDGRRMSLAGDGRNLPSPSVRVLVPRADGTLWVGTQRGLVHYDGRDFRQIDGLDAPVNAVVDDRSGTTWVATGRGVVRQGAEQRIYSTDDGLPSLEVHTLIEDGRGRLWAGTQAGLRRFDGRRFVIPAAVRALANAPIRTLLQDREGALWIGTREGLGRWTEAGLEVWTERNGLSHRSIISLAEDREGSLWAGTDDGVTQLLASPFTAFTIADGLPGNRVWGFAEDRQGRILVAADGGVAAITGDRVRAPVGDLQGGVFRALYRDRHDRIWAASEGGLLRSAGARFHTVLPAEETGHRSAFDLVEDGRGRLWIATIAGAFSFDGESFHRLPDREPGSSPPVSSILLDRRGHLWFATEQGFLEFDGLRVRTPVDPTGTLRGHKFVSAVQDNVGDLWLASYDAGVFRYAPAQVGGEPAVEQFSTADGLSDDNLYFLLLDGADGLWIGSTKGLDRLDLAEYRRSGAKRFRHYGAEEGYLGVESNQNAAFAASDGRLWFGTIRAAVRYDPERERQGLTVAPTISITRVALSRLDARRSPAALPLDRLPAKLTHRQNSLTIEYQGVSLSHPGEVRYRQRLLDSSGDGWGPPSRATATSLIGLASGRYTFEVQACLDHCSHAAVFAFHIVPPFWRTWWFYSLVFLSSLALLSGGFSLRVRRLERQRQRLEVLVGERTGELEEARTRLEATNRELAVANDRLSQLARADGLTGLANRRAFEEEFDRQVSVARRTGRPLSLVLVDVDFFKPYNDSLGHQAGDACLQSVAASIRQAARRPRDLAARIGGEEFALLLPDIPGAGAVQVAERLRDAVAGLGIPHPGSPHGVVTVSLGAASASTGFDRENLRRRLFDRADTALYQAKSGGRNRVVASPEAESPGD